MFDFHNKSKIADLEARIRELSAQKDEIKSRDDLIKAEIDARAQKIAEEAYTKEVMFQHLQEQKLTYAIFWDLMQAANFAGKVTITLADGSKIEIEGKPEAPAIADAFDPRRMYGDDGSTY